MALLESVFNEIAYIIIAKTSGTSANISLLGSPFYKKRFAGEVCYGRKEEKL